MVDDSGYNVYDKLIDKITILYNEGSFVYPEDLFKNACDSLNIGINVCYKEDIIYIGLYCCQIILNNDIYLKAVSGNSKSQAYENVVRKFINLCFSKKKIPFKYSEYDPESFYLELQESVMSIDLSTKVRDRMQEIIGNKLDTNSLSETNSIEYNYAKTILTKDDLRLSEKFRITKDNSVSCSIFVNDILLLQQGNGRDENEALENTVTDFFTSYGIINKENLERDLIPNGVTLVGDIRRKLGQLFREKKSKETGPINYWDLIQDCAKSLNYDMTVKSGKVIINNITIVDFEEANDYVGNIKACKYLVRWLSADRIATSLFPSQPREKQSSECNRQRISLAPKQPKNPEIMNFPKTTKIYNDQELDEVMKKIAIALEIDYLKDQRQQIWNVLNQEFLKESCNVELKYEIKNMQTECTLMFQGHDLISGKDVVKTMAREKAAKNFLTKYLPSKS